MASIYIQSGIYPGITGYGDLAYFGLNSNGDPWKRLNDHNEALRKGVHSNQFMQNFYNQPGVSMYRAVLIECDAYYLNTAEKAFIHYGNSNRKFNPEGWNKTRGGEGATAYKIPYTFLKSGHLIQGVDLLQFLMASGQLDPGGFIELHDGRRKEYQGFVRL